MDPKKRAMLKRMKVKDIIEINHTFQQDLDSAFFS